MKILGKVILGIFGGVVILLCIMFLIGCETDMEDSIPEAKPVICSYTAECVELPDGYETWMQDGKTVKITYTLGNITNSLIYLNRNWFQYDTDGNGTYSILTKDEEGMVLPSYDNPPILPPGEEVDFTEYVQVPEEIDYLIIRYNEIGEEEYGNDVVVHF